MTGKICLTSIKAISPYARLCTIFLSFFSQSTVCNGRLLLSTRLLEGQKERHHTFSFSKRTESSSKPLVSLTFNKYVQIHAPDCKSPKQLKNKFRNSWTFNLKAKSYSGRTKPTERLCLMYKACKRLQYCA